MAELLASSNHDGAKLADFAQPDPVVAHPDEPLRVVVYRMAETGLTRLPVVERGSHELAGMISLEDLLGARARNLTEERTRERVLRVKLPFQ
jgi:CBS domain-containing protein